jgi:hypothetical protein
MNKMLKQWLIVGVGEIILSLVLIAIAPNFLNSKKPIFGFLIWFTVPTVLVSSSVYVGKKITAAKQARKIFVTTFPEYSHLETTDFLGLSPADVTSQIDILLAAQDAPEIQELNISLFEILEQTKNEKN